MIGDPCILQTPNSYGYLVGRKHKITASTIEEARDLARRILEDPANVQEIRTALGTNDDVEGLTEWLASAIYGQHYHLFVTKPATPFMEAPQITDINTLIVDPPKILEGEQLVFSLVDAAFEDVPADFTLTIAGRDVQGRIEDGSWREKDLGKHDEAEVVLRGIDPPPPEDDEGGDEGGGNQGDGTEGGDGTNEGGNPGGGTSPVGPVGATQFAVVLDEGDFASGWAVVDGARHDVLGGVGEIEGDAVMLEEVMPAVPDDE